MDGSNRRKWSQHFKLEVGGIPGQLWQDLDALLRLMGIELEDREAAKWKKLGAISRWLWVDQNKRDTRFAVRCTREYFYFGN
jgi:hypothetical protein